MFAFYGKYHHRFPRSILIAITTVFQVNGRWSSFRQGVIQTARDLVLSNECSYAVCGSTPEAVTAALALLKKDTFHFGKTSTVSSCGNFETQLPELVFNRARLILAPRISARKCSSC